MTLLLSWRLLMALYLLSLVGALHPHSFASKLRKLQETDLFQQTLAAREELASHLHREALPAPYGILVAAGGEIYLRNAAAMVGLIRLHYQCELPIEIIYNGAEELYEPAVEVIQSYQGVRCVDGSQSQLPGHHKAPASLQGYVFKIWALYVSSFDKVLMLDADNFPLVNPSTLFEDPLWMHTGNKFWPDYWQRQGLGVVSPEAYEMFDLQPPWTDDPSWTAMESGQLLLDRRRHQDVLEWLWFIATFSETINKFMWGDKDTFRLAFDLANKSADFNQVNFPVRSMIHEEGKDGKWAHLAMLQSLDDGTLAFMHRASGPPKEGDAKNGDATERNPLKRFWPTHITTPLSGDLALQAIYYYHDLGYLNSTRFTGPNFHCVLQHRSMHTICPPGRHGQLGTARILEEQGFKGIIATLLDYQRLYDELLHREL